MNDDETELPAGELPTFAPDAFATVTALARVLSDPKLYGSHMRSLQAQQAAAAKAVATLATERATFDQETGSTRAELDADRASLEKRRVAVQDAENSIARREKYIADLEKQWKFVGETDPLVFSGVRDPEGGTPLMKARRAHGIDPPLADDDEPAAGRELSREIDGVPFPPNTTITRDVAVRVSSRSARVRADN